jgi:peptide/nickel transport system ATP-binding protein
LIVLTHQLDVIRQLADETIVLFAGRIVEHGPTMRVMGDSAGHPYTQELLRAHADPGRSRPLELAAVPAVGCAYALRCDRALEARCTSALPPLTAGESATHAVRCWWQVPPTSPASATQRPVDPS